MISGAFGLAFGRSPRDVLTAANTWPEGSAWRDRRLMWSSAVFGPWIAVWDPDHFESGSRSEWVAKYIASSTWLLHIPPICPLNEMTAEMSSGETVVPFTLGTKGVPQAVSPPVVRLT